MWICGFCETENADSASSCVCCGKQKTVAEQTVETIKPEIKSAESSTQAPQTKRTVLVFLGIVLAVAVMCFFTIHKWIPATCTQPETCSVCGKVRAPANGHSWSPATCTQQQKCYDCGATGKDPLGHNWISATYDEPKTCSRCGKQEGEPKGYIGAVDGYYSEEWVSMPSFTNWLIHPYVLYNRIDNCRNMDFTLSFSYTYGNPFGEWEFFVRDENGRWISVGIYDIQDTQTTVYIYFTSPVTVTAMGVDRRANNSCDTYIGYSLSNVQQYVD